MTERWIKCTQENVALSAKTLLEEAAWHMLQLGLNDEVTQVEAVTDKVDVLIGDRLRQDGRATDNG